MSRGVTLVVLAGGRKCLDVLVWVWTARGGGGYYVRRAAGGTAQHYHIITTASQHHLGLVTVEQRLGEMREVHPSILASSHGRSRERLWRKANDSEVMQRSTSQSSPRIKQLVRIKDWPGLEHVVVCVLINILHARTHRAATLVQLVGTGEPATLRETPCSP